MIVSRHYAVTGNYQGEPRLDPAHRLEYLLLRAVGQRDVVVGTPKFGAIQRHAS